MDRSSLLTEICYRVELDLLARSAGAVSRTEIRFRSAQPGATTYADLALERVTKIELNEVPIPQSRWQGRRLELPPLGEENVLVVEGEISFSTGRDGLCTFVDDGGERFVYLHLPARSPETAAEVMCCFVDAGRAAFDLAVVAPAGWTVVSHAQPAERPHGDRSGKWRFVVPLAMEPRPAFAAGPWTSNGEVYARPSLREVLDSSPVAALRDTVLRHHERLLCYPEPYMQLPCVFIPGYGSQGSNGGGIMVCHERVLPGSIDPTWHAYVLWVIAHEAAHSWFGGVFERRRPEDHWLYEGIATYLCHRAMADLAPDLSPWARYHILEEAEAHDVDNSPDAHAVAALPASAPETATRGLPPLVYGKPAAVLRHLERIIGRDAVERALATLLHEHAGGVADTTDFVRAAEQAAGGIDLSAWADDWLYTAGVNTLWLDRTDGLVHQSPSSDGRLRTHHISIAAFDLVDGSLIARPTADATIGGATTLVPALATDRAPDLIVLNAPASSYVRVRLDELSLSTLSDHLGGLPSDIRAVCWIAASQMVKDGRLAPAQFRALAERHGSSEIDPQVRDLLANLFV